jgi:prevent-host-death family protein
MAVRSTKNVKTAAEFEKSPRAILNQVRKTRRPVLVTVNGKPGAVLVDAQTYERKLKVANLRRLLEEAEEAVRAGQTRDVDDFFDEFFRAKKISP